MTSQNGSTRQLPSSVEASGNGKKCSKWAVQLIQKSDTKGKFSFKGEYTGMSGIPYIIKIEGKELKDSLDGTGLSATFAGLYPSSGNTIDVQFGLHILPNSDTLDISLIKAEKNDILEKIGKDSYISTIDNYCAVRMSYALNSGKDVKYVIPRSHKVASSYGAKASRGTREIIQGKGVERYITSTYDIDMYIRWHYKDAPLLSKVQNIDKKNLKTWRKIDYRGIYPVDINPRGIYRARIIGFGDAVGHTDIFHHPIGRKKLDIYDYSNDCRTAITEFYLWIFSKIIFLKHEKRGDIDVFIFEHTYVDN